MCALIGPNGAGKTTLLRLLAGLSSPTAGTARVLGRRPEQSTEFLASIGYLAQEAPLYGRLTANDHIEFGRRLNPCWDRELIRRRLAALRIPSDRPVGTLSGGQRAQGALGLALAKRPRVLLLDEPMAALDPLARHELLASLTEAVADGELTAVISSISFTISNGYVTTSSCSRLHAPSCARASIRSSITQVAQWTAPQPRQPRVRNEGLDLDPEHYATPVDSDQHRLGGRHRDPMGNGADHPRLLVADPRKRSV